MPYVDPQSIHNPATGNVAPATWGDTVRDDLEFLIDPPACSVFNTAVSVASGATLAALAAGSENYDNNGMHSTVTFNSRITIQTAGRYLVSAVVIFAVDPDGNRALAITVNGTTDYLIGLHPGTGTNSIVMSGTRTIALAVNDYIECRMWHTALNNINVTLDEFAALYLTR